MKTPPLLLGLTLLFWGWQSGLLWVGAVLGVALEAARFVKARWDFTDEDFRRIWIFCSVLFLAVAVYSFTSNEGPTKFGAWLRTPSGSTASGAGQASSESAAAMFRRLPMVFFLFVAAQAYSSRREIPLTVISQILRRRWKKLAQEGRPMPAAPGVNVGYPYFALCLFAAANHRGENNSYFWGLCALLGWMLWTQRTRRFGVVVWLAVLAVVIALGHIGQSGIGRLQNYLTNLDPTWLTNLLGPRGFDATQADTSLGRIGRIKTSGRIVIRLETVSGHAPNYLRAASYRVLKRQKWFVDDRQKEFVDITPESDGIWVLLPDRTNQARVKITSYLEGVREGQPAGLLPLPEGCSRIENLPSYAILRKNGCGAVLAEGTGLAVFEAGYGPGLTIDTPFNPDEAYTNRAPADWGPGCNPNPDLNVEIQPAERAALARVVAELGIQDQRPEEKLRAVAGFFQDKFKYSTWQEPPKTADTNETAVSRFLIQTRSGHCEYFATATVLLLRELGIPARYAVGYAVHETSGKGYVVRERDAHAWCIVWDARTRTWRNFDTTPASWVEEESKHASPMQWLSDAWSWCKLQISKFRWGQTQLRQYLLWSLAPVLALLFYQIVFRRKKRRRGGGGKPAMPDDWPGLNSEFYLIERKLAERGLARTPNEPLSDWLERAIQEAGLAEIREALRELLRLHYRCRFDPQGLTAEGREELKRGTRAALAALEQPRGSSK